ncbi:MAG: hypothetical protein K2W80_00555, partial [Burkholderiales bacterium]|nr:hypothetical protein [Burkholderiales bacterium]
MNPNADSTAAAVHRWNLDAARAASVPASTARRADPPCRQGIDRSRLQLRLSVSIGEAGPAHASTHGAAQDA